MPALPMRSASMRIARHRAGCAICALPLVLASPGWAAEGATTSSGASEVVFLAEVILLLLIGRLLGEAMQRIGQPAVIGQLLAGILLGPSVFGVIWPEAQHAIFPASGAQKSMIDAVSQLGIMMLLLLTGMETDLGLVRKVGRAAVSISIAGIALPFACGFALGEFLPDALRARADVLLTGELRFHDYVTARARGLALVLPGHYATERFALPNRFRCFQNRKFVRSRRGTRLTTAV